MKKSTCFGLTGWIGLPFSASGRFPDILKRLFFTSNVLPVTAISHSAMFKGLPVTVRGHLAMFKALPVTVKGHPVIVRGLPVIDIGHLAMYIALPV